MAEPFLAEIRMVSFNFAPKGWALCNGQLLPIAQNQALFSILGTTYGGDGRTTFGLPDLRGRTPIHVGSGHTEGERGGESAHTLTIAEIPSHVHSLSAVNTSAGNVNNPNGVNLATSSPAEVYAGPTNLVPMSATSLAIAGGSQAHNNMQPYLTVGFCIALVGIFPSPN
jgi:microcystin-dependent protein